jgi:hypothetical protein
VADGARLMTPAGRRISRQRLVALGALVLAIAPRAPSVADAGAGLADPRPAAGSAADAQDYSYYYVPRLSELNRLVGYIFRSGLVRMDAPEPTAAITRYAAYSCEGTLYAGGDPGRAASRDIDWSTVTELHAGPVTGPPSLVIERARPVTSPARPLVLYFSDATTRYQLHQALAVLMTECRPGNRRSAARPEPHASN